MGRYYYGQIAGKCYPCTQGSDDAENFGGEGTDEPNYKFTCGCEDFEEYDAYSGICETCGCEFICEEIDATSIAFHFDEENVDYIQRVLDEIKVVIPDIPMPVFNEDKYFEYEFNYNNKEHLELQARWCLGQQILACILQFGECDFSCGL